MVVWEVSFKLTYESQKEEPMHLQQYNKTFPDWLLVSEFDVRKLISILMLGEASGYDYILAEMFQCNVDWRVPDLASHI